MTTARQHITDALIGLGEFDPTESIDAQSLVYGLRVYNRMLGRWKGLMIPYTISESFLLTSGTESYSMGTAGSASATRASRIKSAFVRTGTTDYPVRVIDQRKYNNIRDKSTTTDRPFVLYYDPVYPVGRIYFYYTPGSGYTAFIESEKDLHTTLALATDVSLPVEYEEAIVVNLRNRLAPSYGKAVTPLMLAEAREALDPIKQLNASNRLETMDMPAMPIARRVGYNIETDE